MKHWQQNGKLPIIHRNIYVLFILAKDKVMFTSIIHLILFFRIPSRIPCGGALIHLASERHCGYWTQTGKFWSATAGMKHWIRYDLYNSFGNQKITRIIARGETFDIYFFSQLGCDSKIALKCFIILLFCFFNWKFGNCCCFIWSL